MNLYTKKKFNKIISKFSFLTKKDKKNMLEARFERDYFSLKNNIKVQQYLQKHNVYISLTSSPNRLNKVIAVLYTLDLTNVHKIIINIPQKFQNKQKYGIPKNLLNFPKIVINRKCKKDFGPLMKIIGALYYVKDPNAIIISIDDDTCYPIGMINTFVEECIYSKKKIIFGGSCQQLKYFFWSKPNQLKVLKKKWPVKKSKWPYSDIIEGFAGIVYKAKYLSKLMKIPTLFKSCLVSDDIIISYFMAINNISRKQIWKNKVFNLEYIKQFEYGLDKDALHRGFGFIKNISDNHIDINSVKYYKCLIWLYNQHQKCIKLYSKKKMSNKKKYKQKISKKCKFFITP